MIKTMRNIAIAACLLLAACGSKKAAETKQVEDSGVATVTSIDDVDLPVDKSDQVTSIDAATGDARGMPRDGGAAIEVPKPEPAKPVEPEAPATETPPPPPTAAATVPAPASLPATQ